MPAIAHQVSRRFVLRRWHVNYAHAIALAAKPCAQVDHQLDDIEPIRLRSPLVAFDRNAGRIDDVALDAACLKRTRDPEPVLAGLITDDDAHICWQRPLLAVLFNQVQHRLQTRRSLRLRDRMHRRLLAVPVV